MARTSCDFEIGETVVKLPYLFTPLILLITTLHAFSAEIRDIYVKDNNLYINFRKKVPDFRYFQVQDNIVIDIYGKTKERRRSVALSSPFNKLDIIGSNDRSRIVIRMKEPYKFEVIRRDKSILVKLRRQETELPQRIESVDFRRGPNGEGRILLKLRQPNAVMSTRREGLKVIVTLAYTQLPSELERRWDVLDFGTVVGYFDLVSRGKNSQIIIYSNKPDFTYTVLQTGKILSIEVRKLTPIEIQARTQKKYQGEKITLNFQNISIRAALHILAEFTGLNIITDDSVEGNITLRLHDVPWDQALEVILRSKDLGQYRSGNILWVAPLEKIQSYEKKYFEQLALRESKVPLQTEIIQVKYARASDIAKLLLGARQRSQTTPSRQQPSPYAGYAGYFPGEEGIGIRTTSNAQTSIGLSVLSPRGLVNFDPRTNVLIVRDTPRHLEMVRKLVQLLDRPVRQVLLESRVVIANDDFSRTLGVRVGAGRQTGRPGQVQTVLGGTGQAQAVASGFNNLVTDLAGGLANLGVVDLPAAGAPGLGIAIFKVNEFLMSLELSALQQEGRGEVISLPKVITQNNTKATIEQGVEIPYQTQSPLGGTNTQFKRAVLRLDVTPQITPDDKVILDLTVTKDTQGANTPAGPAIDTRRIRTKVQVDDGETVVLGGIFEGTRTKSYEKVPFFGDLPGIGFAFRREQVIDNRRELLIFITPKILEEDRTSLPE